MKHTFLTHKSPHYLVFGILILPFAISRFFQNEPDILFGTLWTIYGILAMFISGYIYKHRKLIIDDTQLTIRFINKTRKRSINKSEIKRIWENKTHFVIDLEKEVIEIKKSLFHQPDQVAQALSEIRN